MAAPVLEFESGLLLEVLDPGSIVLRGRICDPSRFTIGTLLRTLSEDSDSKLKVVQVVKACGLLQAVLNASFHHFLGALMEMTLCKQRRV